MTVSVRRAGAGDWDAIARVCVETGSSGGPVDEAEREEFSRHWIAPYRELRPDWTWAALSDGEVVGYLTGSPDTLSFEKERRRLFDPPPDSRDFFPAAVRLKLWTEHPAHLMMNVLAGHRGRGTGALLLRTFIAELRRAGVPSTHLICGPHSCGFFERMAFRAEAVVSPAPGLTLRAMTRPVD